MKRRLRTGVVRETDACGILLSRAAAEKFRFQKGDYLCIASDRCGTQIVRQIKVLRSRKLVLANYIYLDKMSLAFLGVDLDEPLEVWPSEVALDCP